MPGDIKKSAIEDLVVRSLADRELYGYELMQRLRMMGIRTASNYLYEILSELEGQGLLKGRWAANPTGKPGRHYYSLSRQGRRKLDDMVKEAIDLIQERVLLVSARGSPSTFKKICTVLGAPVPRGKFVIALPYGNPATSYQIYAHRLTGSLPNAEVYIVKPPGMYFSDQPSGATILDGHRNNMPFKDGFADFLLMAGLPSDASIIDTIQECGRVLKVEGHFVLKHPNSLTTDRAPKEPAGYEQYSKLVYEIYERDKTINTRELIRILTRRFGSVKEKVIGGSTWFHTCVRQESLGHR
ncbi:MAG: PadR family transcriptional regulator [Nitrososphaerota archaeon]|nr:PadR family transcriptional regulator [Nitrososphaerota archaeon]